ncbi:nuclear transcription factor Y subunit A-3-like [Bidens hawaiensis]|uniref:nuclear transcription factor Y subunit A-3-like n=1 Tax=Bidens hawaiensis TaxID=980011 RepID=UPI004049F8ED
MVHALYVSEDATELTRQVRNQDSSICLYNDDDDGIASQAVDSQTQCISDENYKLEEAVQAKPILFMGNPSFGVDNHHQVEKNRSMVADHYLNGLYAAYGSLPMIQPHLVQIAPPRVPLPLDLSEDGPIYVNAKQYHGILRRRQIRAKLEAQNKLVKNRKPYLHESRHKHALNRVRGSGGRFIPTKKTQQSKANSRFLNSHCCSDSHSSGNEHMMINHAFPWGIRGFGDHNHGQ